MHLRTFGINERIGYKEVNIDKGIINKIYEINNHGCEEIVTIPDGCIDIEIVYKDDKIYSMLCGSHIEGMLSEVGNYDYCFGVKFRPGLLPSAINANVSNIIDARIDLQKFMSIDNIENELFRKSSFENKVDYFTQMFDVKNLKKDDIDITTYVIEHIEKHCGVVNVVQLVEEIGYSQCYVNRIFKNNVGLSVKKYAEIVRLQESIRMINKDSGRDIYGILGYYDQSHFIKSFKKFTTFTPKKYMDNMTKIMFV